MPRPDPATDAEQREILRALSRGDTFLRTRGASPPTHDPDRPRVTLSDKSVVICEGRKPFVPDTPHCPHVSGIVAPIGTTGFHENCVSNIPDTSPRFVILFVVGSALVFAFVGSLVAPYMSGLLLESGRIGQITAFGGLIVVQWMISTANGACCRLRDCTWSRARAKR